MKTQKIRGYDVDTSVITYEEALDFIKSRSFPRNPKQIQAALTRSPRDESS